MGLTGFQIQKLLPRTNCKECGSKTCMAFAMKLAARKAEISQCPDASEEARRVLGAAYEPPVQCVKLGPDKALALGDETVLYRHDKTFVHQTALAVNVDDDAAPEQNEATLAAVSEYCLERVGEQLFVDMVAVSQRGGSVGPFVDLARRAHEVTGRPLVLKSGDPRALRQAAEALAGTGSVLASGTPQSAAKLWPVARDNGHALALTAPDLDQLVGLTREVRDAGFKDLVLQLDALSAAERFQAMSVARRLAIKQSYRPLGYAFIRFVEAAGLNRGTVEAVGEIVKYGGICVLPALDAAQLATLMTLRLNIYTDPQKPIHVEPKVYSIGAPTPGSPVFLTTNFSLTFFLVSGEIENTGISAWLVVPECEGMSVLTAWAAGKLSGTSVAQFCQGAGLERKVTTREMVIPGCLAQISGELEEKMPGWTVIVGPQEVSDLEGFVKGRLDV